MIKLIVDLKSTTLAAWGGHALVNMLSDENKYALSREAFRRTGNFQELSDEEVDIKISELKVISEIILELILNKDSNGFDET